MCKPFSAIVTRNAVLWSRVSDTHEDIIAENHLNDKIKAPDFVRVELTPQNMDFRKPISEWLFTVDQDYLPDWWSREWAETITREEAAQWLAIRTITTNQTVITGTWIVLAGSPVITQLGGAIKIYDHSAPTITQSGGIIETYDHSAPTITQSGGAIETYDHSAPTITQSGGVIETHDHSAPTITQSDGLIRVNAQSTPVITQSGGVIRSYEQSAPVITQSGGVIKIYDQSTPVITQSGGVIKSCEQSVPMITQSKGYKT